MAELVYACVSEAHSERIGSSSLPMPTFQKKFVLDVVKIEEGLSRIKTFLEKERPPIEVINIRASYCEYKESARKEYATFAQARKIKRSSSSYLLQQAPQA